MQSTRLGTLATLAGVLFLKLFGRLARRRRAERKKAAHTQTCDLLRILLVHNQQ